MERGPGEAARLRDGMASTDAHLIPDAMVPVDMTPPTGHAENDQVLDDQTETFRSEGWKRFRVEQNHTEGANSATDVPTVPPHVVGDEEGEVGHDWGYTTGRKHCNNARVRRRVSKVPVDMTPPTGQSENARVPDDQTETFRSEGWKRFRVEQNHTDGVCSTTEVPTVSPRVVGDEEGEEVTHDWGYTTGGNHCNNPRVRRRVSKIPRHDSEINPATDDSSAANMTHLEPKLNCSLDQKFSGDVDSKGATAAMDSVHAKNSTDLNLYLDAVLTDIMKSRKRKHRSVLKRIKRSKAIVMLAAVGVLIAGSVAHVCLRQIVL